MWPFAFLAESYSSNQFYSNKSRNPGMKKREEIEKGWSGVKNSYDEIPVLPGLVLPPGMYVIQCSPRGWRTFFSLNKNKNKKIDLCALEMTLKWKTVQSSAWLLWREMTSSNSSQAGAMKGCRCDGRIQLKTQGHMGGHENLLLPGDQKRL